MIFPLLVSYSLSAPLAEALVGAGRKQQTHWVELWALPETSPGWEGDAGVYKAEMGSWTGAKQDYGGPCCAQGWAINGV